MCGHEVPHPARFSRVHSPQSTEAKLIDRVTSLGAVTVVNGAAIESPDHHAIHIVRLERCVSGTDFF